MKTFAIAAGLLAAGAVASPAPAVKRATTLPTVSVKGNAFFAGDDRFYIRGIDYQPGGSSEQKDPIADATACKRDITQFKDLGINTIRVYTVDNSADHDECMNALAEAGIYLALDVNTPLYSLRRDKPSKSYNKVYLQSIFATIDAFQGYSNTLVFFSGNEVLNAVNTTSAAPYVKAVDRDMRSYINARGYRKIPVGYSAADVAENRLEMAQYMNCGPDGARSDFYSFNDYSWCDPDTFDETDWGMKVKNFSDYSIPLFLSEYGCNKNLPRKFNQVAGIYSDKMTSVYSGGLVYEYSEEGSDFGLVTIKSSDFVDTTSKDDYKNLKSAFAATANPTGDGGYKSSGTASKCPSKGPNWDIGIDNDQLPAFPDGADEYFKNGAGKAPGLKGGSQDAGPDKPTLAAAASGAVISGASTSGSASSAQGSKGAASSMRAPDFSVAPLVCGLVVVVSSIFGAGLMF